MSIKIEEKDAGAKLIVEIDNGHAKALKKITNDYRIKSVEDAISFMLSVLVDANGKPVEVEGQSFVPSKNILKQDVTE